MPIDKNSPEVNRGYKQNVPNVPLNLSTGTLEKFETGTNVTNSYSSLQTSGEFSSEDSEETEDEDIEINVGIRSLFRGYLEFFV
ncbi:MAG: hypothetical protein RXQ75_09380 [Acidianus hospitalis]